MKFIFLILTLLNLSISFASNTIPAKEIKWLKWDLTPNYISNGKFEGEGFADKIQSLLVAHLPEYKHSSLTVNALRGVAIFQDEARKYNSGLIENRTYCSSDLISHPDLDFDDYLSIATFPFEGFQLITSKKKASLFGKKGDVLSSRTILENKNLNLVLANNRPYSDLSIPLTNYLSKNKNASHIHFLSTGNIGAIMLATILADRYDYTYDTLDKLYYRVKISKEKLSDYTAFRLKENDKWFYGFVSCSRTKEGKKIIKRINDIIRKNKNTRKWRDIYGRWLPPYYRKKYNEYYQNVFLKKGDIFDTNPRSALD